MIDGARADRRDPDTERSPLACALAEWVALLGSNHVLDDRDQHEAATTAPFATWSPLPAILRPGSRSEVQECVRIATRYRIPIYPISSGKNEGYGSRAPGRDCVLLDLGRLNRVLLAQSMVDLVLGAHEFYA